MPRRPAVAIARTTGSSSYNRAQHAPTPVQYHPKHASVSVLLPHSSPNQALDPLKFKLELLSLNRCGGNTRLLFDLTSIGVTSMTFFACNGCIQECATTHLCCSSKKQMGSLEYCAEYESCVSTKLGLAHSRVDHIYNDPCSRCGN